MTTSILGYRLDINYIYDVETLYFVDEDFRLTFPRIQLFRSLLFDSFVLALLIYTIHCHSSTDISKKQKVDARQVIVV